MQTHRSGDVTALLRRWEEAHDREALDAALPHLIRRLRQLARHYLAHEPQDHTLEPTALVHETYLKLLESKVGRIESRAQFFAYTARLMRQILVDHARCRQAAKRGGDVDRTELGDAFNVARQEPDAVQVLIVHDVLDKLEKVDPRQREIVELRYFVGLSVREVSKVLEVSVPTVERGWRAARCWLEHEIRHQDRPAGL